MVEEAAGTAVLTVDTTNSKVIAPQIKGSRIAPSDAQAIANDGTLAISSMIGATPETGFLFLILDVNVWGALFFLRGAGNAVYEISDPLSTFSTTLNNAGTINVVYDSGYKIQNKAGNTIYVSALWIGV